MQLSDAVRASGIDSLDAEVLAAATLKRTRSWVIAHQDAALNTAQTRTLRAAFKRRMRGEPVAYILGTREFHSRTFFVTKDVLIPRPATELLVERAERAMRNNEKIFDVTPIDTGIVAVTWLWKRPLSCTIADIGTGSGCIAITLAKLFPKRRVIATDISDAALRIARKNAKANKASVTFRSGRSVKPLALEKTPFVIVSNPPYIPNAMKLQTDVAAFEPKRALRGGKKGDEMIAEILDQALRHPQCVGVIMECREDQVSTFRARGARPI